MSVNYACILFIIKQCSLVENVCTNVACYRKDRTKVIFLKKEMKPIMKWILNLQNYNFIFHKLQFYFSQFK